MRALAAGIVALLAGVAVAKPAWRPPRQTADASELAARVEETIRAHDVSALAGLFSDPISFDGLWFADASCAKKFGKKGVAEKADVRTLAGCLAKQKLLATTRRSNLTGGAILTFEPGVEVELMFRNEQLVYVATPWADAADRGEPGLTVQAFESLRMAGTTQLDAVLAKKLAGPASAWVRICLDKTGAITSKNFVETKPSDAMKAFEEAIADWKFRAFELHKTKLAACSLALLTYPSTNAPATETIPPGDVDLPTLKTVSNNPFEYELDGVEFNGAPQTVPPTVLEKTRTRGNKQIEPDPITKVDIAKDKKQQVVASFKLCLDPQGRVFSVSALKSSGYADYDLKIDHEMRNWAFKPSQSRVCTAYTFIYRAKP